MSTTRCWIEIQKMIPTSATSSADYQIPITSRRGMHHASLARGNTEQTAARKSELHANTPAIAHTDSLGRTFLTVAHNKFERKNNDGSVETVEEMYPTESSTTSKATNAK